MEGQSREQPHDKNDYEGPVRRRGTCSRTEFLFLIEPCRKNASVIMASRHFAVLLAGAGELHVARCAVYDRAMGIPDGGRCNTIIAMRRRGIFVHGANKRTRDPIQRRG